jgi:hypothetical protein
MMAMTTSSSIKVKARRYHSIRNSLFDLANENNIENRAGDRKPCAVTVARVIPKGIHGLLSAVERKIGGSVGKSYPELVKASPEKRRSNGAGHSVRPSPVEGSFW